MVLPTCDTWCWLGASHAAWGWAFVKKEPGNATGKLGCVSAYLKIQKKMVGSYLWIIRITWRITGISWESVKNQSHSHHIILNSTVWGSVGYWVGRVVGLQLRVWSLNVVQFKTSDLGGMGEWLQSLTWSTTAGTPSPPPESKVGLQRQTQSCAAAKFPCMTRVGHWWFKKKPDHFPIWSKPKALNHKAVLVDSNKN